MGRVLRGNYKHQIARREDLLLPVRVRAGVLHLPHRASSSHRVLFEADRHHALPAEVADRCSGIGLVNSGYIWVENRVDFVYECDNRGGEEHHRDIPHLPVLSVHRLVRHLHLTDTDSYPYHIHTLQPSYHIRFCPINL